MANIETLTQIPERRKANKMEVAHFFGVSLPTIDNWIMKDCPVIQRGAGRGTPWVFDLLDVALWRYGNQPTSNDIDPDSLSPRERRDWFESELKKIQFQKEQRQLIPAEEVETVVATAFSTIAQHIRSMPDNLERKLGISSELAEAIEIANDDYLEELAISLSKIAMLEDA